MTVETRPLPLGIRLHNPGNLRAYVGMDYHDPYVEGFAKFRHPDDGLRALFLQIWLNYNRHNLRTLMAFVQRYAPASENDVARYINLLAPKIGMSPLKHSTQDLQLNCPWNALAMARGIIAIEQGPPPSMWAYYPEWFKLSDYLTAIRDAEKWSDV